MSEDADRFVRHVIPDYHGAFAVITHERDERRECCEAAARGKQKSTEAAAE